MSDHIRPPHPGCAQCTNLNIVISRESGDLGDLKAKLIRAQERHPELVDRYVEEIKLAKDKRADSITTYHQHYASAHPAFADSAHPFAKAPTHRLTPEDIAEIKQLLRDGLPQNEIAEAFDVSPSTIQHHAARAGLTSKDSAPAPAENDLEPLAVDDQPWATDALCAQTDPESFFPEKGGSTREAKRVCANCTVAAECLDYALANQERFGIWGGLSERERRNLLRAMDPQEEPPTQPPTEGTAA